MACRGAWLFLGSPDAAELLGHAGFDAIVIDHEHSPGGIETAVHQMRAVRAAGDATVLARVGSNDAAAIQRLLDCGAEGLLLPNVESAEAARAFVAACRYPPKGRRGAHFTVSRAAGWGFRSAECYRDAEAIFLAAMIESLEGVRAIPEIARVEGLSMLFIGPLDLTGSIGRMGRWNDPEVESLLRDAEAAVLASGLALGGALVPGDTARAAFARGHRFVTVGSDAGMLRQAAASLVQEES
ncbi:MAG: aldolase/citrate lyase family protein [Rubrivivax sp.]